jgi:hypothetical protein
MPSRLVQNTPLGVDAATEHEEGCLPGFGPVDLTKDVCPIRRALSLGKEF